MTEPEMVGVLMASMARQEARLKKIEDAIHASKDDSCDRLASLEVRVQRVEDLAARMLDAADRAFEQASYVNQKFRRLPCIVEQDTDPGCHMPKSERPKHRDELMSLTDIDEISTVTAAQMTAVVRELKKQRSSAPISLTTPGGWAVKLSAVGAGLVGLAFALWEMFKSFPVRK